MDKNRREKMKTRVREKIQPIHISENDTICLHYTDDDGVITKALEERVGRNMIITEAVIFDVEKGDFGDDVKDGIGGAFLEV